MHFHILIPSQLCWPVLACGRCILCTPHTARTWDRSATGRNGQLLQDDPHICMRPHLHPPTFTVHSPTAATSSRCSMLQVLLLSERYGAQRTQPRGLHPCFVGLLLYYVLCCSVEGGAGRRSFSLGSTALVPGAFVLAGLQPSLGAACCLLGPQLGSLDNCPRVWVQHCPLSDTVCCLWLLMYLGLV